MSTTGAIIETLRSAIGTWPGRLALAILVLGASYVLGKVFVQTFGRRAARRFQRPSITRTVLRSVRVMLFVIGLLIVLPILGFPLSEIALSVTVFSAVLGIVLAPIVGNIISGLFVLADQPYEIGDLVEFTDRGQRGFVEDITLRYTKIFTLDNTFLVVPNAEMRGRDIVNYSAEDERTRLSLSVVVTYEGDLQTARELIESAAAECDDVIGSGPDIRIGSATYPASPVCYIDEYGDHGVNLELRYWAKRPYRLLAVRSAVQERVWERLESAENVTIAYPHSHLVFDDTSGHAQVRVGEEPPTQPPDRAGGTGGPATRSEPDEPSSDQ